MTTDLLRVEASERVDKSDFEFLADGAIQADHRQVIGYLFTDPTRDRGWILDGFAIDCPAGKQVRVTLGRAILGQRIGGEVKYGVLTSEGDATKIVDINAYAAGPYGIYVRFGLVAGDQQSRIFWNPSGAGSEYAQTIATRYQANWTLRVEAGSPGAEWLQIGTVAQATLAASANPPDTGITDQRAFYFEGSINSLAVAANFTWNGTTTIAATGADTTEMAVGDFIGFKTDGQLFEITGEVGGASLTIDNSSGLVIPAGAGADTSFVDTSSPAPYASGWSADGGAGGSTADDRKNDRSAYGVADAQMFNAAVRQCLEDIKGRGLRRWWERDIGGMNIGFDAAPIEDVLSIGDANCGLSFNPTAAAPGSEIPTLAFDGGDSFFYDRSANTFYWAIVAAPVAALSSSGLGIVKGLDVGQATTPIDDTIRVFDTNFGLYGAAIPSLKFHAGDGDEFRYNRAGNRFEFVIGGTEELLLDAANLYPFADKGLELGKTGLLWKKFWLSAVAGDGMAGDFNPTADLTSDLGSAARKWQEIHVSDIFAYDDVDIDGGLRCGVVATNPAAGDGIFSNGLVVGYDGAASGDSVKVFDANFGLFGSATPYVKFDTDASLKFNRAGGDQFEFTCDGNLELILDPLNLYPNTDKGLELGKTGKVWKKFFLSNALGDGVGTDLVPTNTGAYDLGTFAVRWRNGYFSSLVYAQSLRAGGDAGGLVNTTTFTNGTGAVGGAAGTVGANGNNAAGFIKIFVGAVAAWVPYWTTIV